MTVGSGLCAQFGLVAESTVGTAVTVSRFHPVNTFRPKHNVMTATSAGLRACAKAITDDRTVVVGHTATGDAELEILNKGFGLLLKCMIGGNPTATQIATSGVYRQINTPLDMTGQSMTVQAGFPESYGSATVRPYTYRGSKITDWELSCSPTNNNGLVVARVSLDMWDWTNATALAAASYPAGVEPFRWGGDGTNTFFTATIGGTASTTGGRTTYSGGSTIKGLRGVSLKGTNALRTDRMIAGQAGIKSEQIENGFRAYTGDLDIEFADRTQIQDIQDAYTSTALKFEWTTSTATGGQFPTLRVIYPIVKLQATPEIGGPDILDDKATFTAFLDNTGVNPLIQIEYEATDATV